MNKAVIYIRVSTEDQTEISQLKPCEAFCEKNGYSVVDVIKDHARSAYKNVERPGYNKILTMVKKKQINHVVVWAIDRWTRKGPTELKNSIEYLSFYKVQFHSVQENWIENINLPGAMGNVIRDFFFGMMAWMAEEESKHISERVKNSKRYQKALKKGKVGRSNLPEKTVQEVLKLINEGKSYRYIHNNVIYKSKFGKENKVSIGAISNIANSVQKTEPQKTPEKEA